MHDVQVIIDSLRKCKLVVSHINFVSRSMRSIQKSIVVYVIHLTLHAVFSHVEGLNECLNNHQCPAHKVCCHRSSTEDRVCRHTCFGESCEYNTDCGGRGLKCCGFSNKKTCTFNCFNACSTHSNCRTGEYCCQSFLKFLNLTKCAKSCIGQSCRSDSDCVPGEICQVEFVHLKSCAIPIRKSCKRHADCTSGEFCCSSDKKCASNCAGKSCTFRSDCSLGESCCEYSNKCAKNCSEKLYRGERCGSGESWCQLNRKCARECECVVNSHCAFGESCCRSKCKAGQDCVETGMAGWLIAVIGFSTVTIAFAIPVAISVYYLRHRGTHCFCPPRQRQQQQERQQQLQRRQQQRQQPVHSEQSMHVTTCLMMHHQTHPNNPPPSYEELQLSYEEPPPAYEDVVQR